MNQELVATVLEDGFVLLDRQDTENVITEDQSRFENDLFSRYRDDYSRFLFYLGLDGKKFALSPGLSYLRALSEHFSLELVAMERLEELRENADPELTDGDILAFLDEAPFIPGREAITADWIREQWRIIREGYRGMLAEWKGSVEEFFQTFGSERHVAGKVYFHLVQSKEIDRPFAFLATYTTGIDSHGQARHVALKNALVEYGNDNRKLLELLSTIHLAAKKSRTVAGFLESGEIFHPLALTASEALSLLKEIPLYQSCGIICRIPDWWKNRVSAPRLKVSIGEKKPSGAGMEAILGFQAEILLGGEVISEEEVKRLIGSSEGLAFIKGKWVEADPEKLKVILAAYEKARKLEKEGLSIREALQIQFRPEGALGLTDEGMIGVSSGAWLGTVLSKMSDPSNIKQTKAGEGFLAELRPYQQKGLDWLGFLRSLGFGACLADDMGLGKTVQILALLHSALINGKPGVERKPFLLVVPASLIANWMSEIAKFAPALKYSVAHPSFTGKKELETLQEKHQEYHLIITSYSIVQRLEWLTQTVWDSVILDEAQAVKNAGTRQAQTVKRLQSAHRIAMTGTPVENRLGDLWSLFDFLNPGLLGSAAEFSKFARSLSEKPEGYTRLKQLVGPYILRRLKTDKTVISDLPDKIEMKTWSDLSKKQIVLYEKYVEELSVKLEEIETGIERKGLILSALMKLKQLCNHPSQYLGTGNYVEEESGKFQRLRDICETIREKRERVLVFTQFAEITGHLKDYLDAIFGYKGLVLHGGIAVGKRKEMVDRFQGHEYVPFIVLSLKAGGTGLNLTAARHVIHFDRWWNPAVENQATDRAFRIGQKQNVLVHKFVTRGTIEEKIDRMIEDKKELAEKVVGTSEANWITELGNRELRKMFELSL
jgi:non-specific serine/threonine protein kinase